MNKEKLFRQRVAEINEWCMMRLSIDDLQGSLRSAEFGTSSSMTIPPFWDYAKGEYVPGEWHKLSSNDRQRLQKPAEDYRHSLLDKLSDHRARMLADAGKHPDIASKQMDVQKFVVYLPEFTCSDGAAEHVSRGYFDTDNVPPWDTWLMYFPANGSLPWLRSRFNEESGKLISWVPPQLVELVDSAIRVNPEHCISWVTKEQLLPELNLSTTLDS